MNMAKLAPPVVASVTSALALALGLLDDEPVPPTLNASAMISGSTSMISPTIWVRRRRSCRMSSTRNGSVWLAR